MRFHRLNIIHQLLNWRRKLPTKVFSFLIFYVCLFSFSTFAQENLKYEEKEIYLRIKNTFKRNDSIVVFLDNADSLGIKPGMFIKGWQAYKDEIPEVSPERQLHEIGTGKMVRADSIIAGFIKLYDPDDSLAEGDMITIRISIPVLPYRSVFSELAFQNIFFTDLSKKQLYRLQDLVFSDGKKFEDSLYSQILKDFKTTYDYAKGQKNLAKVWLQPLTGTRLTGKTPFEILGTATMNELEAFLLYVTVYPAKYMGTGGFVVSESIGGWLSSNAPYSYPEVKKALFPIRKNKSLFKTRLPIYKYDILNENAVRSLDGEVIDLLDQLKYAEAHELADFAFNLAYSTNDSANLPFAYLIMAEVYQDEGLYSQSIFLCDKAGETARKIKDIDIEFQAKTKKAYCLFKLSKFSESESLLAATTKKLYEYRPLIDKDIFLKNVIKIFEQRYTVSYKVGNYKMAFEFIDSVIAYDKLINSYESVLRNAMYYKFKGEVYNAQGEPDNALVALQNALDIYSSNNDVIVEANIENETAKSYFNLSSYDSCIYFARKAATTFLRKENYSEAAYSYSWIGQSYWSLGAFDSAIKAHDTAILYGALAKDTARLAWSWLHIGELYQLSGEKTSALKKFETAEFFYSAKKDSLGLAAVYNDQGVVYLNDENYKTAKSLFENAKKVSIPNIEVLFNLGQAWRNIDTVKSRKYFEECHKQSLSNYNTDYQFQSSYSLARLAYSNKNMAIGRQYYQECNALSKLSKKLVDSAYCLSLKGYEFGELTQLDSALKYYKDAKMAFSLSNKTAEVYCLNDIANIFISTGEFSMADSVYQAAIKLAHSIHDQIGLGYTLSSSTFLYGATGQFQKGLSNSDSAFSIFFRSGNNIRLAGAYFTKATLLNSMGNFRGAIRSNLIADSIYKHELITDQRSIVYTNIGVVYRSQEDYVNALKNFDLAIKLLKKGVVDESYLLIQGNRAECLHYLKRSKEAETLLLQILPQATKLNLNRISSGMAITMGDVYLAQKKFEEAKNSYTNALNYALASGEREKIIETLTGLGRINNQTKKIDDAEKNFRQAVSVVEEMNGGTGWDCYYELGLIYFTRSKFDSAATYFSKAIEFLEKNMKNLFGGDNAKKIFNNDPRKADLYNKITFTYFKLGDVNSAWEYANRYNLAGLREFSGAISITSPDKQKQEALQKIFSAQKELQELKAIGDKQQGAEKKETLSKVRIRENEYRNLINDMADKYNDLAVYFKDVRAQDLKTYKEDIPEDMAVLIYMQHENTLMVISLTHDSLSMDTIPVNPKQLVQTFIESAKSGLLSMRQGTVEDAIKASMNLSDKLYSILIAQLSDSVRSKKRYCIVPTGFYSNLPFQCLGNYGRDNEFHYVIEGHSIFYVTDVSIFRKNQEGNIRNDFSSFAAFGVPDSKLHFNLTEVANVGKIVGYDSTIYADERATKNKAIQNLLQKKIIHFSTHGVLSFEKYSLSYLKLMPDKDNDGRLTMQEVNSLTIPPGCDMVVLSACETAVNKTLAKGWNISPANAFLESNVRTVVASLWKVDDEATGILMENFYTNLKSMENVDKAEALRLAQLALMKNSKFAHPNYWGAFAMYGDWR